VVGVCQLEEDKVEIDPGYLEKRLQKALRKIDTGLHQSLKKPGSSPKIHKGKDWEKSPTVKVT